MKKPNAADVYYFIQRNILKSETPDQLATCQKMINCAMIQGYMFCEELKREWRVRDGELILQTLRYPVTE